MSDMQWYISSGLTRSKNVFSKLHKLIQLQKRTERPHYFMNIFSTLINMFSLHSTNKDSFKKERNVYIILFMELMLYLNRVDQNSFMGTYYFINGTYVTSRHKLRHIVLWITFRHRLKYFSRIAQIKTVSNRHIISWLSRIKMFSLNCDRHIILCISSRHILIYLLRLHKSG